MAPTRLQQIVAAHRARAALDDRRTDELIERALATPEPRPFIDALRADGLSVISEIKRRSPSAGDLNTQLDAVSLAQQYEAGGASCLSVLTDEQFFGGSVADLQAARQAVGIPVLRKDFTVSVNDIADARSMGADAVLLIVAALDDDELALFTRAASELSLAALIEVHDQAELERAMRLDPELVGVNQRNLHTFEIDNSLAEHLAPQLDGVISVAESGVRTAEDATRLAQAGYDGILVGTALVTSDGPGAAIKTFIEAGAR